MKNMIYESELKVLEILWSQGDMIAKDLTIKLNESTNWSKTTSYTIIKRCIEKGWIKRIEPHFKCHALLTKEEARKHEVEILTNKMFNGSSDLLVASLLEGKMTPAQISKLRDFVQEFAAE